MESKQALKKPKKKCFLAPLKAEDGSKSSKDTPASLPLLQKKGKTVNSEKRDADNDSQKHLNSENNIDSERKKDTLNFKESKKVKKAGPSLPAKSLSDADYEDLFRSVLQSIMADSENGLGDNKDIEAHTKETETIDDVSTKELNGIRNKSEEKNEADADSIASEDVDTWADSPCTDQAEQPRDLQPPLKPKSVLQKKTERKGIFKPKKLLFQDADNTNGHTQDETVLHSKEEQTDLYAKQHVKQEKGNIDAGIGDLGKAKKNKNKNESKELKEKIKKKKKKEEKGAPKSELKTTSKEKQAQDDPEEEKGTWIQCSNTKCGKWRYVDGIDDPILVPDKWECKMNPDENYNACDLPEVEFDESEHICTKFTIGSLVWAKMDGYPWWPGMIEADPDYDTYFELLTEKSMNPFQYHVTFFDDHVTRAWIKTSFISPYITGQGPVTKGTKGHSSYKKEVQQAIVNADKAVNLCLQKRISTFGFLEKYKKNGSGHGKRKSKSSKHLLIEEKAEKKTGKSRESQCFTESNSSDMEDSSDILEDTEYKPAGTKSRGVKMTQENEDLQPSEATSITRDETLEETDADADSYQEGDRDTSTAAETKLDSNVFTMELETSHSGDIQDSQDPQETLLERDKTALNNSNNNGVKCSRKEVGSRSSLDQDQEKSKKKSKTKLTLNSKTADSAVCKEPALTKDEKSLSKNNKNCSDLSKGSKGDIDISDKDKTSVTKQDKKKKKKMCKLALKSHTLTSTGQTQDKKPKCTGTEEESDIKKDSKEICGSAVQDDDTINSSSKKNTKKKPKAKHLDTGTAVHKDSIEECKAEKEGKVLNKPEQLSSVTESNTGTINSKQSDGNKTNSERECWGKDCKKEKPMKNKSKNVETSKPAGDSDQENVDPSDKVTSKGEKTKKKKLKRQANESIDLNTADLVEKTKKSKISLSSAHNENKAGERELQSPQSTNIKLNRKKLKNFAAPIKVCKTSDRKVPELDNKDNNSVTNGSQLTKALDHHVVPDITSQESVTEGHTETDIEPPMFGDIKDSRIKTLQLKGEKIQRYKVNNIDDDSEEEELDLKLDLQKVDFNLPDKILKDSDDSNDDDDMDCEPNKNKVIVEELADSMQTFGRFGGRCTDHGSESDPMELIED